MAIFFILCLLTIGALIFVRVHIHECIAPGEQFDLITANSPLIPIEPHDSLEVALFDPGLQATKELIAALFELLTKRGRCYLLTSDVIDREGYKFDIATACREGGLKMSVVAQLHKQYESYRVHRIERRGVSIGGVLVKIIKG